MVRPPHELPDKVLLRGARAPAARQHQGQGVRRHHKKHAHRGQSQISQAQADRGRQGQEGVDRHDQDDSGLFRQKGQAHACPGGVEPNRALRGRKAGHEKQGQSGEQRHGAVQEDLAGHDDVIGHERQEEGRQDAGSPSVKEIPEAVDEVDGCHPHPGGYQPPEEIIHPELEDEPQNELEEQWMGAEDREEFPEVRVLGDGGRLSRVHRFVTVEPEGAQSDEAQAKGRSQDERHHGPVERGPASQTALPGGRTQPDGSGRGSAGSLREHGWDAHPVHR